MFTVELPADGIYTLGSMPSLMKAQTSPGASPRWEGGPP
jgi:hypothetical protein